MPCEYGEGRETSTMTFGYEDKRTWRPVVQVVFDFVLYEELKFVRMNKSFYRPISSCRLSKVYTRTECIRKTRVINR
jgi:hypothetical protein